ncbi:MAG: transglutaminase family protein, partial [Nitrospinota bacterium]|nr:transglutaminase family protein [Nitrospinota bacterium]
GGGWRGYDPTAGLVVSNQHVAVASGPTWILTTPTTGNFRGTGADSSLDFEIQVKTAESLAELNHPSPADQK